MNVFSWSFASAVLFSQLSHWGWLYSLRSNPFSVSSLVETLVSAAAFFLLLRPVSVGRLITLSIFLTLNTFWFLPEVPNHRLMLTVVSLSVLLTHTLSHFKAENLDEFDQKRQVLFSLLRCATVLLYFFAFFHKLNSDFLSADYSCAVRFLKNISPTLASSQLLETVAIWATLIFELLIVPGLLWAKTRKLSVVLALVFHVILSFDLIMHFLDFSSTMFCLLSSFMIFQDAKDENRPWFRRYLCDNRIGILACLGFCCLLVFGFAFGASDRGYEVFRLGRQAFWLIYAACFIVLVMGNSVFPDRILSSGVSSSLSLRSNAIPITIVLLLVLINGLSPYIGIKTRTAFAMYSNLRISDVDSNHLLVPRSFDLFGLLADRVKVVDSENVRGVIAGAQLPYITLQYLLEQSGQNVALTYRYQGKVYHYPRDPLPRQSHWLAKKFTLFKPLGADTNAVCIW